MSLYSDWILSNERMAKHPELHDFVQQTLRVAKATAGVNYREISERLAAFGMHQTPTNLTTKLARGDMSAQTFLAILRALSVDNLDLSTLNLVRSKPKAKRSAGT